MEVVLLFNRSPQYDSTLPPYLMNKYAGVKCYVYEDKRFDKSYIPAVRPYLLWQYLRHDPAREHEQYFYIDADVIFREWIDFSKIEAGPEVWSGSDCSGYIGYDYIKQTQRGPEIVKRMAEICGIREEQMLGVPGIGAHIVMTNPTAAFWEASYNRSIAIWNYFTTLDSDIQKWTAEMWAQQWTMVQVGIDIKAPHELDFVHATDPIEKYDTVKIMHNAGVPSGNSGMFFKSDYMNKLPFGENFDWVDNKKCSRKYVDAIEKVVI